MKPPPPTVRSYWNWTLSLYAGHRRLHAEPLFPGDICSPRGDLGILSLRDLYRLPRDSSKEICAFHIP